MKLYSVIARDIDDAAKIEGRVQHRETLILRHIDLIEHAETAALGRAEHRPLPKLHLAVPEGVRPD